MCVCMFLFFICVYMYIYECFLLFIVSYILYVQYCYNIEELEAFLIVLKFFQFNLFLF